MLDRTILIEVQDLSLYIPVRKGFTGRKVADVKLVDRVSFTIRKGEILGLAGERGCGKSTLGKCVLQLIKPTGGQVLYNGRDLCGLKPEKMRDLRRELQMVSENPSGSLNPRMRIGDIIAEPLLVHKMASVEESRQRAADLLSIMQIDPEKADRYPHEFNMEQKACIGIARSMSLRPALLVCDDPALGLDTPDQAQVLQLLKWFRNWLNSTYLYMSRDIQSMPRICDRIMVMSGGRIIEIASSTDLQQNPLHPYTRDLFSRAPSKAESEDIQPSLKSPSGGGVPLAGCRFQDRCEMASPVCHEKEPELHTVGNDHLVACHRDHLA